MPRNGSSFKKWLSCFASSSSSDELQLTDMSQLPPIPNIFHCPISLRLMDDPVYVVPSAYLVERACFEACRELDYVPHFLSSSRHYSSRPLSSFSLTPAPCVKQSIVRMRDERGRRPPRPISRQEARSIVRRLKRGGNDGGRDVVGTSQEPSSSDASAAAESSNSRRARASVAGSQPAPSSPHSAAEGSSRSAAAGESSQSRTPGRADRRPSSSTSAYVADPQEEEFFFKNLTGSETSAQKTALDSIVELAEASKYRAVSICTPRIMAAIIPMLSNHRVQVKASKAIMALSEAEANRVKIVGCGAVPALLSVLTHGFKEARCDTAVTLCNLARHEGNRPQLEALGAMPAFLEKMCDDQNTSFLARKSAATALFYMTRCSHSLAQRLASIGAVPKLLRIAAARPIQGADALALRIFAASVLHNLSVDDKALEELIVGRAVELMVKLMKEDGGMDKYCLPVMFNLCGQYPAEFKKQALDAGAVAVLAATKEGWDAHVKEMAKTMLTSLRSGDSKGEKGKDAVK